MDEECFNCAASASDSYTLVLESEKVLEETVVCEDCVSGFRDENWIEIHDPRFFEEEDYKDMTDD